MYYYEKRRTKGSGLIDSILSAVTSQATKTMATEVGKQVATKALTEVGNRASNKIINKIIAPRRGNGLSSKSKATLNKYIIPIEDYVKI